MSNKGIFSPILNSIAFAQYLIITYLVFPFLLNNESWNYTLYKNHSLGFIDLSFKLDQLSAFFTIIFAVISALITIYFIKYSDEYVGKYSMTKLTLATHIFAFSMIAVVLSSHVFGFLFFWELMSLSSYLLVIYDHEKRDNINAGFIYFITTHIATAFLLLAFLSLAHQSPDLSFSSLMNQSLDYKSTVIAFILFLLACGIKAGIVPFHFWLPLAHPAAPSHVSALMSALMVKVPIYLLIRVIFEFLSPDIYMGYSILAIGLTTALIGIIYALKETDIKKLLAYSTIENVGIILVSLSLSIIFFVYKNNFLSSLALITCLFHIMNHAIYKSALFLGAGSIVSATHTRDLNKMGGLIKLMPQTAIFFLIPVMSIMALPFFNGFISEWLLYQSLMKGMSLGATSLHFILPLSIMIIAMVVGLAFVTFSKLFITAFLGYNRSDNDAKVKEVSISMWLPIAILSGVCVYIGIQPQCFKEIWINILQQFNMSYPDLLSYFSVTEPEAIFPSQALLPLIALVALVLIIFNILSKTKFRTAIPWTCGYKVNSKAQYNSSSYSQPNHRLMNNFYKINFTHIFKDIYFIFYNSCKGFRDKIQSGNLHSYLLYILISILGGLIYAKYFN